MTRIVAFLIGLFTAAGLADGAVGDPRIELVQLQIGQGPGPALERVIEHTASRPESAKAQGLAYLKAHLLLKEGRREAALLAWAEVMAETPKLAPWARYRLAEAYEADGSPAVAAGMAATLLGSRPPQALIAPTVDLLQRTLAVAGDCRSLKGLGNLRLQGRDKRRMALARAACARRSARLDREQALLTELVAEDSTDDSALVAADRLMDMINPETAETSLLVDLGMAYYHHRDFPLAVDLLGRALKRKDAFGSARASPKSIELKAFELRYALARSHFWLGHYPKAAAIFADAASGTGQKKLKTKALYQQARSFELAGSAARAAGSAATESKSSTQLTPATTNAWSRALDIFTRVSNLEPKSGWASAALISRVRLGRLLGRPTAAQQALVMLHKRGSADNLARALLFLAVSDLVEGRGKQAGAWLSAAQRTGKLPDDELTYWRGRAAELEGRPKDAVEAYAKVLAQDPHHPFAQAARARLDSEALSPFKQEATEWFAAGPDIDMLYKAWLLLGDSDPRGVAARRALSRKLARDPKIRPFLDMATVPAAEWPLWQRPLTTAEELFLGLGLFGETKTPVLRHFPIAEPSLSFTASRMLAQNGATRRSLYIAEILAKRIPDQLPRELLPTAYHELLYPFRYSYLILREASKHGIDPYLLAGLIREESRFDAAAFSAASARGLTQFIYPTAQEIAESIELGPIKPQDIHRPEIAITLGAAYLRRLSDELDGSVDTVVAAYNAGEPQAKLWQHYCFSREPEEFWSKVAFKETRRYVRKVLTSRSHYRDLYGKDESAAPKPVTPPPVASGASGDGAGVW